MVRAAHDSEDSIDAWTLTPEDYVRIAGKSQVAAPMAPAPTMISDIASERAMEPKAALRCSVLWTALTPRV
jgi:hypothetical protein